MRSEIIDQYYEYVTTLFDSFKCSSNLCEEKQMIFTR